MCDESPSQFQALATSWQSANDALSRAQAGVAEALGQFRTSGDASLLRPALLARRSADERLRTLMHAIWGHRI